MSVQVVCIIPSRYESTRFPGKPLADLCGKPMIQHVYERVLRAKSVTFAAVATDDERIFAAVQAFGGRAVMTSPRHRSGTDRIAEAVETLQLEDDAIVVNIQGDQPLFEPSQVDEVVGPLMEDPSIPMSTLIYRIVRDGGDHPPERRQGRLRQPALRPLFFPRHRALRPRPGETGRLLQAPRDLRLPPRIPAHLHRPAGGGPGASRVPRTAPGAGARPSDQGGGHAPRLRRGRHPRGAGAGPASDHRARNSIG